MKFLLNVVFIFIYCLISFGCRSKPLQKNLYISPKLYTKVDPFSENINDRLWFNKNIKHFNKVHINIEFAKKMPKGSLGENITSRALFYSKEDDLAYLKKYIHRSFKDAFLDSKYYQLVDNPSHDAINLNFYVVQIIRGKPVFGIFGTVMRCTPMGLLLIPVDLSINGLFDESGGVIAMETLITDNNHRLLGVMVDRQKGTVALLNIKDFTTYGHIRANIDNWSENIVTIFDTIKENKPYTFEPINTFKIIDF